MGFEGDFDVSTVDVRVVVEFNFGFTNSFTLVIKTFEVNFGV